MIRKIESIKDTVYSILQNHPKTRDNDRLLIIKVWAEQNPKLRHNYYQFMQFAVDFIDGKYTDPESIRRTRQKIQEQHIELRGTKYSQRHEESEIMRKNINQVQTGNLFEL